MKIVCESNVRKYYGDNPDLVEQYRRIAESGECPFCEGNIAKEHQVVEETDNWWVVINPYPYKNTALHLLIIPKRHVVDLHELTIKEWMEMKEVIDAATNRYPSLCKGYGLVGLVIRLKEIGGVTLYHLHFHLIVPRPEVVVNFGIG